jgi:tRNA threonylcarbamoyl adenosine modification protein (Sua5/YciO/YrdC/YwlC family)
MIEYVIGNNPDDRILEKASQILKSGGVVCFPTDTNWIMACDPYSKDGADKLYRLKHEEKKKHFSLLCDDFSRASEVAHIDNGAFKILKRIIPGHYTFIFEASKKISKVIKASKTDKEIGIRFVPTTLVQRLIEVHGDVLMSTNIVPEMLGVTEDEPVYSYMIEDTVHELDLIIDPGEFEFVGASTIVDFSQGTGPMLVRQGAGDSSVF